MVSDSLAEQKRLTKVLFIELTIRTLYGNLHGKIVIDLSQFLI